MSVFLAWLLCIQVMYVFCSLFLFSFMISSVGERLLQSRMIKLLAKFDLNVTYDIPWNKSCCINLYHCSEQFFKILVLLLKKLSPRSCTNVEIVAHNLYYCALCNIRLLSLYLNLIFLRESIIDHQRISFLEL